MKLSRGAKRLLDLLRWYHHRFGRVFPLQKKLAAHLGVKIRQLRRYVAELVGELLLRVHKGGRKAAEYELAPEALAGENDRSKTGPRHVKPARPLITVSTPPKCAERKPPRKEDLRFEGALKHLQAMGYK